MKKDDQRELSLHYGKFESKILHDTRTIYYRNTDENSQHFRPRPAKVNVKKINQQNTTQVQRVQKRNKKNVSKTKRRAEEKKYRQIQYSQFSYFNRK